MKSTLARGAQVAGVCVLLGVAPARATTIEIGLATTPGSITLEATGGAAGVGWAGSYDNYLFNAIYASDPNPVNLGSGTVDVTLPSSWGGATQPVYVYVTETGLTSSKSALNFTSALDIENLPSGWSEIETTFVDKANTAFGTPSAGKLASLTTQPSQTSAAQTTTANGVPVGSTFSLTEVYELISNGLAGVDISSETITDPAPAPPIGSGIPGMLAVGGVLLGAKLLARWRRA